MAARLNSTTRKPRAATPAALPREVGIGDNSAHGEEAERVQLISIVSQLSAAEDEIEVAKGPLKAAQAKRSKIIGLGKASGFTAKELTARLDEMKRGTRENATIVQREHKHRRWLGIIDADQSKLILGDKAPVEVKDAAHWAAEGFKAGLRQMEGKPPPECPERFVQAWLKEHGRGQLEVLTANVPRGHGVREQAAADFKADNPDAPEPGTPEAAALERKQIAAATESLNNLGAVDQGFEATPEELAAQTTRQAVQGAREGEEEPASEDVV